MILLILGRGARRRLGLPRGDALSDCGVAVLEPSGLSVPGWAHDLERPREDRLVVDGQVRPARDLTAVVTAIDAVSPGDLPDVRAEDRGFVASEMTAFLRSWLRSLACPVLDPPTPLLLSGAAGERSVWSKAAAAAGIADRQAFPVPVMRTRPVTVVAGRVVGQAPEPAATTALALAQAAEVTAAHLVLTDDSRAPALSWAGPWWHTPSLPVLRALLAHVRALT